MVKKLLGLWLIALAVRAQQIAPPAPRRVALVIGNAEYTFLPKLPAVKLDTTVIQDALRGSGFEIHLVTDFQYPAFLTTEAEFEKTLRPGDICFIYYAGYTIQADNDNYLLPVNFDPRSKGEMQTRAYHFKRLLQKLESRGVGLKILVLEAPPQLDIALPEGSDIGLMQPDISESHETIFASAAFPGRWAAPSPQGAASPFTRAVSKAIREPGLMLAQVFDVAKQDKALTQTPYVMDVLRQQQQFYFHAPVKTPDWPRPGIPVSNRIDREEYLWIRPARFLMGCVPGDNRCSAAEKPQHEVTITKGFWMGRNEVQVGSYQRYVKAKGVRMPSGPIYDRGWKVTDQPLVNVRWEDAAAYCAFAGGRLPTEAEWEMAARGGKANEVYPMNSEESSRDKANFNGQKGNDLFEFVAPVRKFDPNPFGLYDLAGNVWEFVNDFFSPAYYTVAATNDPQGPKSGKDRVIRGGSYDADPKEHLRISFRKGFGGTAPGVGFRCVVDDTPETRKILVEPPK